MKNKDEIINEAIRKLQKLTGEGCHGYRSEVWNVIEHAMKEQDRNTRHACAEAVLSCEKLPDGGGISKDSAHNVCMNVKAI